MFAIGIYRYDDVELAGKEVSEKVKKLRRDEKDAEALVFRKLVCHGVLNQLVDVVVCQVPACLLGAVDIAVDLDRPLDLERINLVQEIGTEGCLVNELHRVFSVQEYALVD